MAAMPDAPSEDTKGQLLLDALAVEFPHIPPACGTMLAQAAILCLDKQGHVSGVTLTVSGTPSAVYSLHWSDRVTEPMQRFWNDFDEATEQGAYAVRLSAKTKQTQKSDSGHLPAHVVVVEFGKPQARMVQR